MKKYILNSVKSVSEDVSFSTPGHKGREFDYLKFKYDVTELDETDNLLEPTSAILKSMDELKRIYKSKASYYLTQGSSLGILTAIVANLEKGDKILVERTCHKSVYNAVILSELDPTYIHPIIDDRLSVPIGLDLEDLKNKIRTGGYRAVVVTSPNYFGQTLPLEEIYEVCKKYDTFLIVDEAHGAHLNFLPELSKLSSYNRCDIAIQSAHKTLPAITGSAFMHVYSDRINRELLEKTLRLFQSTSPSYLMLISMEEALYFMKNSGRENLVKNIDRLRILKENLKKEGFYFLEGDSLDSTRLVVSKENISGYEIERAIKEFGIRAEMATPFCAVFIITAADDEESSAKLEYALKNASYIEDHPKAMNFSYREKIIYKPCEVFRKESKWVKLKNTEGMVSASFVIPYPPGTPILVPGEEVTDEIIKILERYLELDIKVVGLENGGIQVGSK